MPVNLEIEAEKVKYFSQGAKEELKTHLQGYSMEIIKEAGRLEGTQRKHYSEPEITRDIVKKTVSIKEINLVPKKSISMKILNILSTLLLFFGGILFDSDAIQTNTYYMIFYIIFIVVTVVITTIGLIWEG